MPYQKGNRLPMEKASKIGHLDVIQSPLVKKLCETFNDPKYSMAIGNVHWEPFPGDGKELKIIFSADGSIQTIENPQPPFKSIAFVKAALLKMDQYALSKLDKENPHPFILRDIMKESALFHATSFPLRHVDIPGKTIFQSVREILFESIKDVGLNNSLDGALMETLKWLAYEKWNDTPKTQLESFGCPHCDMDSHGANHATLQFDFEKGKCPNCNNEIFITDMFGLHLNMTEDFAPIQVATDYMTVAETMMILTPLRYYWESRRDVLKDLLLIKDGPLSLRATLSKLSAPIRRFLNYARTKGFNIHLIGQEKSGLFFDHLQLIGKTAPNNSFFYPCNDYIHEEIQHTNSKGIYGKDTNYGAKVFIKINDYHKMVLSIPTGLYGEGVENPIQSNLIGFNNIIKTLSKILSNRFEGALVPIELANGIASLSTYPSAKVLELFSQSLLNQ